MLDRETMRSYMAERREEWRKSGLCPQCGAIRDNVRFKVCAKCRMQSKLRMRRYYARKGERDNK